MAGYADCREGSGHLRAETLADTSTSPGQGRKQLGPVILPLAGDTTNDRLLRVQHSGRLVFELRNLFEPPDMSESRSQHNCTFVVEKTQNYFLFSAFNAETAEDESLASSTACFNASSMLLTT